MSQCLFKGKAEADGLVDIDAVDETVVDGDAEAVTEVVALADSDGAADGEGFVQPVNDALLFLPATHRVQPISQEEPLAAPVKLYASITHLQSEQILLPGRDIVLIGQVPEQLLCPTILLKFPAGQEVQVVADSALVRLLPEPLPAER